MGLSLQQGAYTPSLIGTPRLSRGYGSALLNPISLASGLLTLATFAFQSSITLFQTVQSYRFHPQRVRELEEELDGLSGVLRSLTEIVGATTDVDLSALELPLLRCGKACKDFEQEILKCTSRSGGNRTSFRDWAKLKYMGDNIDGFRQLLAGYKSTIIIALTDANLRKSAVTAESLEAYRDLIKNATDDLQSRLQSIDEKLETKLGDTVTESASVTTELQVIKEERKSTEKCLQICDQLSKHIDEIQSTLKSSGSSPGREDPDAVPESLASEGLQECKNDLRSTTAKLEKHMTDRVDRLVTKLKSATTSEQELAELERLRDEWDTARQCIDICNRAYTHLKENITTVENYGTGDAMQFMVSTSDRPIHGKNRGLGWRTRQVGGHLSDASLQQLSRDFARGVLQINGSESLNLRGNAPRVPDDGLENQPYFKERYGQGFKLTSATSAETPTSSTVRVEGRPSSSQTG